MDRVYLLENFADEEGRQQARIAYEWTREGVDPLTENIPTGQISIDEMPTRWFDALARGETATLSQSTASEEELQSLQTFGTVSTLTNPLFVEGDFYGIIGFDNVTEPRQWDDVERQILANATSSIANRYRGGPLPPTDD